MSDYIARLELDVALTAEMVWAIREGESKYVSQLENERVRARLHGLSVREKNRDGTEKDWRAPANKAKYAKHPSATGPHLRLVSSAPFVATLHPGQRPEAVATLTEEDDTEKLYLVCDDCGEAFEDLRSARQHTLDTVDDTDRDCSTNGFSVLPESEAL